jgi:hypothetical protein
MNFFDNISDSHLVFDHNEKKGMVSFHHVYCQNDVWYHGVSDTPNGIVKETAVPVTSHKDAASVFGKILGLYDECNDDHDQTYYRHRFQSYRSINASGIYMIFKERIGSEWSFTHVVGADESLKFVTCGTASRLPKNTEWKILTDNEYAILLFGTLFGHQCMDIDDMV